MILFGTYSTTPISVKNRLLANLIIKEVVIDITGHWQAITGLLFPSSASPIIVDFLAFTPLALQLL